MHQAAGLGDLLEPGGNVDAIAVDVVALDHDVAEVDADAEFLFAARREAALEISLDLDAASHRLDGAREFGQYAVAGGAHDAPAVAGDPLAHGRAVLGQGLERRLLVQAHQPAIAGDVGRENGGELAFDPLRFHGDNESRVAGRVCL